MVLLAAAICSKDGKALLSRQFVEMSRSRIEGLLAAFPKLIGSGMQHTFVETESVRYVYQPLEKLYVLLVTTKASNILEDLETLRLFARVIPEYSRGTGENDVINNAFDIIFAFDEIVALGYRESVNLAQIRTFTEMDSHEERVARAMRETQEREAKENMKRKAKELTQQRREAAKRGGGGIGSGKAGFGGGYGGFGGGISSADVPSGNRSDMSGMPYRSSNYRDASNVGMGSASLSTSSYSANNTSKPSSGSNNAMKLGSKGKTVDNFVDQLKAEGEVVAATPQANFGGIGSAGVTAGTASVSNVSATPQEGVHCRIEEKINVSAGRDGGLNNMELTGILQVRVNQTSMVDVCVKVESGEASSRGAQMLVHPNIDKQLFHSKSIIQAKQGGKPYPIGQEVGVLKWRLQTQDEAAMPLTINCWPNESGGGCEVNIEYELQDTTLELHDVAITIPLPSGGQSPSITSCEGTYECDNRYTRLIWRLPIIDADNKSGQLEFTIKNGHTDDFFPVNVSFNAQQSYCGIKVLGALSPSDNSAVKFSSDVVFFPEKYEFI